MTLRLSRGKEVVASGTSLPCSGHGTNGFDLTEEIKKYQKWGNVSSLASETSVFLNGHCAGRLGSWIKRSMPSSLSISSVFNGSKPSQPESSTSVVSRVLSELGVSGFTEQQWQTALEASFSIVDKSLASGRHPTCATIFGNRRIPFHGPGLQPHSRFYSTFARLPRRPRPLNHAQLALRTHWPVVRRFASVYHLEERANSEGDNANIQAKYLEMVLDSDPEYVIRRFESGRYAVNSDVRLVYQKALDMTGHTNAASSTSSSTSSSASLRSMLNKEALGSKHNPMHMTLSGKMPTFKSEMWSLVRLVVGLVVIASILSSTLFNSVKSSTKQMQMNYRPDMGEKKYSFADVQGVDEAKDEVQEVVEFLKDPEKFQRLGARLPTGVLLVGPPGTGKTLLAKAIAGEAEVPFFFVSGSEFDEMFVGVGASRVRKLFETARSHKPCVLFIDELDAVGGKRHSSPMHPYSRMTLNQLLVELDGYKELEGVIIIGATNFPEALDDALTRPGRFDNRITISMPDIKARHKILELHSKKITLDETVDLEVIARATTGFTGADLANLINQAALRGCVEGKEAVTSEDLEYAMDKISMGRERLSAVIDPKVRNTVAYHEGGHAIMALFTPGAMPVYKATIVPRGPALGLVAQLPEKDNLLVSKKEMLARIDVCMGGRVAEELVLGTENITTGASSDFEQATKLATNMVMRFGMSDAIGPVAHKLKECSPDVKRIIDEEVRTILKDSYERTKSLLSSHAVEHKRLAEALLKYETLTADEIKLVIAGKPLDRKI